MENLKAGRGAKAYWLGAGEPWLVSEQGRAMLWEASLSCTLEWLEGSEVEVGSQVGVSK